MTQKPIQCPYNLQGKRIWVAGHRGMVGAALVRRLASEGCELLLATRQDANLTRQADVERWMTANKPDAVFVAAAKVGGIFANDTHPSEFLYENLMIEANIIDASYRIGVEKLLFLGSSCIYPKLAPQPIDETALLTGPLEPTNECYAIAKIAGIKLCQAYRSQYGCDYISAMPTNLYGPGDNYDLNSSHVVPALIRKAHEAKQRGDKQLVIWGSGTPRREFLHVDDCAEALVLVMQRYSDIEHINIGSGEDLTIADLAARICRVVGFSGDIVTDPRKPDGTPRKLMSGTKLRALGWEPRIGLDVGLANAHRHYLESL
jgi:GDP-L-fucose synthase